MLVAASYSQRSTRGLRIKRGTEVQVDEKVYGWCRLIHEENPYARVCRQEIMGSLFKEGPTFRLGEDDLRMTPGFAELVRNYWVPFSKDFMDEWWTRGVVAVRLVQLEGMQDVVPVVVRMGEGYRMVTYRDFRTDQQRFVVFRSFSRKTGDQLPEEKVDDGIVVFSGLEADPKPDGKLTSMLASYVQEDAFLRLLTTCAISSEVKRSNPPILTERSDKSGGLNDPEENSIGTYGLADTVNRRQEDMFQRNRAEVAAIAQQNENIRRWWEQRHAQDLAEAESLGLPGNSVGLSLKNPLKGQLDDDNVWPLPIGHKHANYTLPDPRKDLLDMKRLSQETICLLYGVSRSTMVGDTNRSATAADVTQRLRDRALDAWRLRLSKVLTDIYQAIYGSHDALFFQATAALLRNVPKAIKERTSGEKRAASSEGKEEEKEEEEEESILDTLPGEEATGKAAAQVIATFTVLPSVTFEDLLKRYCAGVLPWADFFTMSLRVKGLWDTMGGHLSGEQSRLQEMMKEDPWSQDVKLATLNKLTQKDMEPIGPLRDVVLSLLQQVRGTVSPKPTPAAAPSPSSSSRPKKKKQKT